MDIMNSKKTLLSLINGGILGAPSANQTVKFQYATSIATAAASQTAGALTFAADSNGNAAIYAQGTLVSSKIQNVAAAAASGAKHGGKTITVTYIGDAGSIQTSTFDVIDEAALEAYFSGSKTIALNGTTDKYEVITDGATILVDENNGLKTGLNIAYIAEHDTTGATIALRDNSNNVLSSIEVSDIVGDGVLKDSIYHQDTNILELRFGNGKVYDADDPTTYTKVEVNLQKLIDINDVFIGNDSSIYLDATLDASTVTLNTKMKDPSTAAVDDTGLADAWKVKQYVDSKSSDLSVEITSRNAYIDASVGTGADNKHIYIEAEAADLTVVAGSIATGSDSSLTGTANKLVDGADAATKVGQFVNARIAEEVAKLDASIDSAAGTFISAGVAEVDGKITSVVVHENIGSITGTDTDLTGQAGIADAAATATAVKTFVNGRLDASIQALDADISTAVALDAANGIFTRSTLNEVDGVVTSIAVENQIATTTVTDYVEEPETAPTFTVNTNGLLTGADATKLAHYVDEVAEMIKSQSIESLDASISDTDAPNFISTHIEQKDGKIIVSTVDSSYGAYNYTAATHTFGTATDGLAKVADTQTFVQDVIESLDLANDVADASAHDSKNYIKSVISETNGIVKNESLTTTYGSYKNGATAMVNGVATVEDTSAFVDREITAALTWQILS